MSARARAVIYDHIVRHPQRKDLSLMGFSVEAVEALTAAGYRIIGPGCLDGETLRDAEKIIEARLPLYSDIGQLNALRECLSSIRALATRPGDEGERDG